MGVLTDAGIIVDGKISDKIFKKYVLDVKEMISTGKGLFPDSIPCSQKLEPLEGSSVLNLEDEQDFSEFHSTWRPRYESMVKSLDAPGDFQLAKKAPIPGIFLMDPTAVATALGATPPDLDLPGALAAMLSAQAGGPSLSMDKGPVPVAQYIALYLNSIKITPPELVAKIGSLVAPSPPIPPIPSLPDIRLLDLGYTEEYNFAYDLALAPLKAHLRMMIPALIVGEMPGIITKLAQGDVLGGLVKFVCNQVSADQPQPMSTSALEIAAQQVLQQHQVKYQALVFVGQNVGSGVIVSGLARTPLAAGGLDVFPAGDEEDIDAGKALSALKEGTLSPVRRLIRDVVLKKVFFDGEKWYGFEEPSSSFRPPGTPKASDGGSLLCAEEDQGWRKKVIKSILRAKWSDTHSGATGAQSSCGEAVTWMCRSILRLKYIARNGINPSAELDAEFIKPNGQYSLRRFAYKYDLNKVRTETSTAAYFSGKSSDFNKQEGITVEDYVYSSPHIPGRHIEIDAARKENPSNPHPEDDINVMGTAYVTVRPKVPGYKPETIITGSPNYGDIFWQGWPVGKKAQERPKMPGENNESGASKKSDKPASKSASEKSPAGIFGFGGDLQVAPVKDGIRPRPGDPPGYGRIQFPGQLPVHVAVFLKPVGSGKGGIEYWMTFDGGQGLIKNQSAGIVIRNVKRNTATGTIDFETYGPDAGSPGDITTKKERIMLGWLNIDSVPEFADITEDDLTKINDYIGKFETFVKQQKEIEGSGIRKLGGGYAVGGIIATSG